MQMSYYEFLRKIEMNNPDNWVKNNNYIIFKDNININIHCQITDKKMHDEWIDKITNSEFGFIMKIDLMYNSIPIKSLKMVYIDTYRCIFPIPNKLGEVSNDDISIGYIINEDLDLFDGYLKKYKELC